MAKSLPSRCRLKLTMKNSNAFRLLLLCVLVVVPHLPAFLSGGLFANGSQAPLTVTVRENADGSATFTLSGESPISATTGAAVGTNYTTDVPFLPPLSNPVGFAYILPEGLQLDTDTEEPKAITALLSFGNNWVLVGPGIFSSGASSISGSGSVRVPDFPFLLLTPGTFRVLAADPGFGSDSVDGPEESDVSGTGVQPFDTIYKVIPLDRKPSISGQSPGTISSSSGGKASGWIRITNTGNVPLQGLRLKERSRDFRLGKPARTSLNPGESTICLITFSGKASSSVKVSIVASTPDRAYTVGPVASATEDPEEGAITSGFVIPGELVKTTVLVRGSSIRAPRNPVRFFETKSGGR